MTKEKSVVVSKPSIAERIVEKFHLNKFVVACVLYIVATGLHALHSVTLKKVGIITTFTTQEIIFARSLTCIFALTPFFLMRCFKFISWKDLPLCTISMGLTVIGSYCWHYALSMVPVANASAISNLIPMAISFFCVVFLKDRLPKVLVISIIICIFAVLSLQPPKMFMSIGYLLLVCDICCNASGVVLNKKLIIHKQAPVSLLYFKVILAAITSPSIIHVHTILPKFAEPQNFFPLLSVGTLYLSETFLFFTSYSLCKLSRLQPLYYTRVIFLFTIAYVMLGEVVNFRQVMVAAVIVLVNLNLVRIAIKNKKKGNTEDFEKENVEK